MTMNFNELPQNVQDQLREECTQLHIKWKELDMWTKTQLVVCYIITFAGFIFCTIAMIKDFKTGETENGCLMLFILSCVCWAIFSDRE